MPATILIHSPAQSVPAFGPETALESNRRLPDERTRHLDGNLLPDVEYRAVLVHTPNWHFSGPISHEAFRHDNSFFDPGWSAWPVAANSEDTLAPVRIRNPQNRRPVCPLVYVAD